MSVISAPQWIGATRKGRTMTLGARLLVAALDCRVDARFANATPDEATQDNIVGRASLLTNLAEGLDVMSARNDDERTVLIGGDCSVDLALIADQHRRHGDALQVIYIDAHADLNTPANSPSGALHGMVVRHLVGEGDDRITELLGSPLSPEQIHYYGVRSCDPDESATVERLSMPVHALTEAAPDGVLHIHFDLDVLDPRQFRHTTYPVPDGPSLAAVHALLAGLFATGRVASIAITECAATEPDDLAPLDPLLTLIRNWVQG